MYSISNFQVYWRFFKLRICKTENKNHHASFFVVVYLSLYLFFYLYFFLHAVLINLFSYAYIEKQNGTDIIKIHFLNIYNFCIFIILCMCVLLCNCNEFSIYIYLTNIFDNEVWLWDFVKWQFRCILLKKIIKFQLCRI